MGLNLVEPMALIEKQVNTHRYLPWGILMTPTVNHCFLLLTPTKPNFVKLSSSSILKKKFSLLNQNIS